MSFAWKGTAPVPSRAISLYDLSLLVAERNRLEALGVPRISSIEAPRLPRRARRHSYASGRMRTFSSGPQMDRDAA